jgi:uncharacterized membrane protein YjfL (UPF0719 family)
VANKGLIMENIKMFFQDFFTNITSSEWSWDLVGINILLISMLLFLFKYMVASSSGVQLKEELAEKDNPAFGTVLASSFLSFFIIMSGASSGAEIINHKSEILLMLSYGISGMIMLILSRLIFDKFVMSDFCIHAELRNRNEAAAIMDSGNTIATAMIIFAYMSWVQGVNSITILVVAYGWVISQILLSLLSLIRNKMYKSINGHTLQEAIKAGNIAVATRNSCYRLSIAATPIISSMHVDFVAGEAIWQATMIFAYSIVLSTILIILPLLIKKVLFSGINFKDEINEQQNTGIAKLEGYMVIGLTIVFFGILK